MILERLRSYIIDARLVGDDGNLLDHRAQFPSPAWNVKSWSFRVVEDLLLKRALSRSRLGDMSGWRLQLVQRLTVNAFSYHDDAEYKGLLFSALAARAGTNAGITLVLPEIGPFGLDLLAARCAGFRRFIGYDRDAQTIELCRGFHRDLDLDLTVATSAAFDFERFCSHDHLIVFPDWPHDRLDDRLGRHANVVRYSFRGGRIGLHHAQRRLGVRQIDWRGLFDAMDRLD